MDNDGILVLIDDNNICRICLQTSDCLSNIYQIKNIHYTIKQFIDIQLEGNDQLPSSICYKCRYIIELFHELKITAQRSNYILMRSVVENQEPTKSLDVVVNKENSVLIDTQTEQENIYLNEEHLNEKQLDYDLAIISDSELMNSEEQNENEERHSKSMCLLCKTKFEQKIDIDNHILSEHYSKSKLTPYTKLKQPYKCEECGIEYSHKQKMILHHLIHLNLPKIYYCKIENCEFKTENIDKFKYHRLKHKERKYVCETCGARFYAYCHLKEHNIRHEDKGKMFPCKLCRVVCKNRICLKNHVKLHKLSKKYKCSINGCPKSYHTKHQYNTHMRSHRNDRCFKCHLCISSYTSQSLLNRHLKQHFKKRDNKCDKCSAVFEDYTLFYNHRITEHGPWFPVKCKSCNQGYQTDKQLEIHMERCKLFQESADLKVDITKK